MPLTLAPIDQDLRVIKVLADEKTKKRLESLGVTVNACLTVISSSGGSIVCNVKGGRLALDSEVATKILVG